MVEQRFETTPAFFAAGQKTWISGQDNEQFTVFWRTMEETGGIERLRGVAEQPNVLNSTVFGVSFVQNDPNNRAFDFAIATQTDGAPKAGLQTFAIPACHWAVFRNAGALPQALVEAEMFAFLQWLPASGFRHAAAPEMEVYPDLLPGTVEFWLPIEETERRS